MTIDVIDLRNFYSQRLGIVARRLINRGIHARWPNAQGQRARMPRLINCRATMPRRCE